MREPRVATVRRAASHETTFRSVRISLPSPSRRPTMDETIAFYREKKIGFVNFTVDAETQAKRDAAHVGPLHRIHTKVHLGQVALRVEAVGL